MFAFCNDLIIKLKYRIFKSVLANPNLMGHSEFRSFFTEAANTFTPLTQKQLWAHLMKMVSNDEKNFFLKFEALPPEERFEVILYFNHFLQAKPFLRMISTAFSNYDNWGEALLSSNYRNFSQEGEDFIIEHLLPQSEGFYIDVGANHPFRFSNTFKFYLKGWRGINIEPSPGSSEIFNRLRPKDVNIECGVGKSFQKLTYYQFEDSALNTFDPVVAKEYESATSYRMLGRIDIEIRTLQSILDENLPKGTKVDFLNIDVEGSELDVLESVNWDSFSPSVIICEILNLKNLLSIEDTAISVFLKSKGYIPYARLIRSVIFVRAN